MYPPLLDLLQPVRLLADVHQLTEEDRPPLEQPYRALATWLTVRPEAFGFRMHKIPADHVSVGLRPRGSLP
ncbi:MAG TPA: hypothetical protein VGW38_18520 [Chloroflexota bacterium]|nr:hypothetical protein [Chloroflexota bacterium]